MGPTERNKVAQRSSFPERSTAQYLRVIFLWAPWRWRKELLLLTAIVVIIISVIQTFGGAWAVVGVSAALGMILPPWSEHMKALAWNLATPHLLRSGLHHARIENRSGRKPILLRITGETFGQRARLWCPPGISAEQIRAASDILRSACCAADICIIRDERRSQIVTVYIIREPGRFDRADRY